MKKVIALLTVIVMMFALAACSGGNNGNNAANGKQQNLVMATGGTSGTYYPYGAAVASMWNKKVEGVKVDAQSTGASAENIRLIANGEADVAIVQNDVMDYAYHGTETFAGNPIKKFATMATVYSEVCQIVTSPSTGINSIADLKGKRVSVGDAGSGVEANAKQILGAYGITFDDIQTEHLGFGPSADAMKDKKIDAFFVTAGIPTTAIMEYANTKEIKLLSIDEATINKLAEEYPFYIPYTIPKDAYKGMTEDVQTLAVKATFIVRPDLDEETVYNMTKALFENAEDVANAHAKGAELDAKEAVKGVSVPFHPGAEKYYKEIGVQ